MSSSASNYGSTSSSIQISSDGGNVTLYLPVFLEKKGNVMEMYEKPNITGNASVAIIKSEHGTAIKIIGSGKIELTMEQTHVRFIQANSQDYFNGFRLSMSDYAVSESIRNDQINAWIYSENDAGEKLEVMNNETYFNLYKQKGVLIEDMSNYSVIKLGGETYVAVGGKSNKIARILIDHGEAPADEKQMVIDETWDMGEGYTLTSQAVYLWAKPDPPDREIWTKDDNGNLIGQARLILKKNGRILKNQTIPVGGAFIYSTNLNNETNVPVFVTHLNEVWAGTTMDHAVLRYTWLMSQDVREIQRGDVFGVLEVANTTSEKLIFIKKSDIMLNYQIKQDNGGGRIMDIHNRNESLRNGWHKVNLSLTNMMYD